MMREKQSVAIYSKAHRANVTAKSESLFRPAPQIAIALKCRHVIMPLTQFKRIQRQPHAIVFTTHLQYAHALMRLITSPKNSMRYPRVFSLIKGDTISVGNASQCSGL
jgi:hypothetical protein